MLIRLADAAATERLGQALEIGFEPAPCLVLEGLAVYASHSGAQER
jgi:hypothetical protein